MFGLVRLRFSTVDSPCLLFRLHLHSVSVSSKDYLESSLCLSPESKSALKFIRTKPVSLRSTSNADSVIALFKGYGFGHTHVAKLCSLHPRLLSSNPHTVLNPKLNFLSQTCISPNTLIHIITNHPKILGRSLRRQIAPCIDFLEALFNKNHQALNSFLLHNRASLIFRHFSENTPLNVDTLRLHGVPDSSIHKLLLSGGGPSCLSHPTRYFNQNLNDVKEMGFDLSGNSFPFAIRVYCGMSKERWVSKMEVLKKCFGWTDDQQVLALFMKQNNFMNLSEENLRQRLEFYMKTLGWTPDYMASYHHLLSYNLEKRILPRIPVLEILVSKGLIKKASMAGAFKMSEDRFLGMLANKYQKHLPDVQLIEMYNKSLGNS